MRNFGLEVTESRRLWASGASPMMNTQVCTTGRETDGADET